MDLRGALTQTQSKVVVGGTFQAHVDCVAPSISWSADVVGSVAFKPGSADATVTATSCDIRCYTATATRTLQLTNGKS